MNRQGREEHRRKIRFQKVAKAADAVLQARQELFSDGFNKDMTSIVLARASAAVMTFESEIGRTIPPHYRHISCLLSDYLIETLVTYSEKK